MGRRLRGCQAAGNTGRVGRQQRGKVAGPRPTVILTRPDAQSEGFAAACRERFGEDLPIVISPVLRIEHLPLARRLSDYPTLAFTSSNAVAAIAGRPDLEGLAAYCVGRRTAEEAGALGMAPRYSEGGVEELAALIAGDRPGEPVLHLRGEVVRGDLCGMLKRAGLEADETVVYRQEPMSLDAEAADLLAGDAPVVLPVFSPRSAALLSKEISKLSPAAPLRVVAISAAAAEGWLGPEARIGIAARPDAEAVLDEIGRVLAG